MNFKGKTAIITGATRGIGRGIADLLLERGCNTIITGTNLKDNFDPDKYGEHCLPLNLLSDDSISSFKHKTSKLHRIDILINNAGINYIEPISELKQNNWDDIIKINLTGPMELMRHVSPIMQKARKGHILNISSVFGVISKEKRDAYSASKSGLVGLTKAAALDLAESNVLVNALCPGFTETDLTNSILTKAQKKELENQVPLRRFADVKEIANAAVFLCSDLNTYITGQILVVDGGFIIR